MLVQLCFVSMKLATILVLGIDRKELKSQSLLHEMVLLGNLHQVKQLVKDGANPLDKDLNGDTSLHHAASVGELKILKFFVEDLGCNPATEGWQGTNTLHTAVQAQQLHVVKYLIEECHIDPTALDHLKQSPLHYACRQKNRSVIHYNSELYK